MDDKEVYDIAMMSSLVPAFKEWLKSRGLYLAGPVKSTIGEQDIGADASFYIIGITPELLKVITND
jgi:hypothetical protein